MTRRHAPLAAVLLLVVSSCRSSGPAGGSATPAPAATRWTLVWSDDFAGPSGALVDATKWVADVGGHGWGNEELEYYTDGGHNASLDGDGHLLIRAIREPYTGKDGVTREFTSARLKTQGLFVQAYGRFEARIKIPRGQGMWPAFWLLGSDIPSLGWPRCGEIDVMENIGREPSTVWGSMHSPGYSGGNAVHASYALPGGAVFADDFHVFAVEWEPAAVRWFVDSTLYQTRTPKDLPAGQPWAFDHTFFIILNVAVGGGWPGSPDATTVFPQTMLVDYVRVYRGPV